MSLQTDLARATSEEDVKDAYIKAFGLTGVTKGLVDIRTAAIWFEAKEVATPPLVMFGQLLVYVRDARKRGEPLPAHLGVVDRDKAALLPTAAALPALDDPAIAWPKSGSDADRALAAQLAPYLDGHVVRYEIAQNEAELVAAVRSVVRDGRIIRAAITPDNLRQVFDKWVAMVGSELGAVAPADYAVLFFADIMHDGTTAAYNDLSVRLLFDGGRPVFQMRATGRTYEPASARSYRNFWAIYDRPPETKHRHYLLERRDSLLPLDEQKFKGAFYTPLHIVDKAYDYLVATLGHDWQERYIVWDMCCGVGNLEVKHSNYRNVFMSTLDQADIDIMHANRTCAGATIFQYDYLNDDVTDFGAIDYSRSDKVPMELRRAIADAKAGSPGTKPILVLINPPYGEAANSQGNAGKTGIAKTRISSGMGHLGYAARELFVQFLHRIQIELPNAKLAIFSTLKYVNAPNFSRFRATWTARYIAGFVVHSRSFDSLKGNFPIGFLLWDLGIKERSECIQTVALNRSGIEVGEKSFLNIPNEKLLSVWMKRLTTTTTAIPLKNAVSPQTEYAKVSSWHAGSIGYLLCNSNDVQHSGTLTALYSSVASQGNGYYVTRDNVGQASVIFTVRMITPHTWLNHNDQFLQPSKPLSNGFKADCLIWMLFAGKNLTAGADGLRWNDRDWSLVNHFIPFTEVEVGARGRFESNFLVQYMAGMTFSPEASAVLDAGRALWSKFHATPFPRKIRDEFRLGRPDAGWYQIRRALDANADNDPTDFAPFKAVYAALSAKLRPMVYELGFLPR